MLAAAVFILAVSAVCVAVLAAISRRFDRIEDTSGGPPASGPAAQVEPPGPSI